MAQAQAGSRQPEKKRQASPEDVFRDRSLQTERLREALQKLAGTQNADDIIRAKRASMIEPIGSTTAALKAPGDTVESTTAQRLLEGVHLLLRLDTPHNIRGTNQPVKLSNLRNGDYELGRILGLPCAGVTYKVGDDHELATVSLTLPQGKTFTASKAHEEHRLRIDGRNRATVQRGFLFDKTTGEELPHIKEEATAQRGPEQRRVVAPDMRREQPRAAAPERREQRGPAPQRRTAEQERVAAPERVEKSTRTAAPGRMTQEQMVAYLEENAGLWGLISLGADTAATLNKSQAFGRDTTKKPLGKGYNYVALTGMANPLPSSDLSDFPQTKKGEVIVVLGRIPSAAHITRLYSPSGKPEVTCMDFDRSRQFEAGANELIEFHRVAKIVREEHEVPKEPREMTLRRRMANRLRRRIETGLETSYRLEAASADEVLVKGGKEPLYAISYNGPYVTGPQDGNRTANSGRTLTILLPESKARRVWEYVRREGSKTSEADALLGLWRSILDKREDSIGIGLQLFLRPDESTVRIIEKSTHGIGKPDRDDTKTYRPDHSIEILERIPGLRPEDIQFMRQHNTEMW